MIIFYFIGSLHSRTRLKPRDPWPANLPLTKQLTFNNTNKEPAIEHDAGSGSHSDASQASETKQVNMVSARERRFREEFPRFNKTDNMTGMDRIRTSMADVIERYESSIRQVHQGKTTSSCRTKTESKRAERPSSWQRQTRHNKRWKINRRQLPAKTQWNGQLSRQRKQSKSSKQS